MIHGNRFLVGFVLLCTSFLVLAPLLPVQSCSVEPPVDSSVDSRFSVESQPQAPLCVSLAQASWSAPRWSAKVTLSNCGSKDVSAYEVEYTEDYENARDVWSSDGKSGTTIAVGGVLEYETGGAFRGFKRDGTPVGELQRVVFGLVSVTFADGSSWHKRGSRPDSPEGGTRSN